MLESLTFTNHDLFDGRRIAIALLLAFALGQIVALAYTATFRGLSYSRATVHGMALGSVVTCMLMLAVGSSIAAGIGIAGGLSAVRFRTSMRDPRDIIFVFAALGVGMACGADALVAAMGGAAIFCAGAALLHVTGWGARTQPDGLLRFALPPSTGADAAIARVLREHCRAISLVTLREAAQGTLMEHAYQITMSAPELRADLVANLREIPGIQDVALLLQEPTLDL